MENGNVRNTYRTQKDIDIARMSALKSAVELMAAFPCSSEVAKTGITATATAIADKFLSWIYSGEAPHSKTEHQGHTVDTGTGEVMDPEPKKDAQQGQGVNPGRKAAFHSPTLPDWLKSMFEALEQDFIMFNKLSADEMNNRNEGGWVERNREVFGNRPGDPYPISQKQYGFIIGLLKRVGVTPNGHKDFIAGLSSNGASELIDFINQQLPSGKDTLNKIKEDLKDMKRTGRRIDQPRE